MEESGPVNRCRCWGYFWRHMLDVIKIIFQVHLEPTSPWELLHKEMYGSSKYTGMMQATKDILRQEGLPGFWRGNVPSLFMVMPYTSIQFAVLHRFKTSVPEDHIHLSPCLSYLSEVLAGPAVTPKVYTTMTSSFVDIVRSRGFRGIYAGLTPTLVEIIPYAGLQFGTYETFKRWTLRLNGLRSSNQGSKLTSESLFSFQLFVRGFASGTCAKAVYHLMWSRRGSRLQGFLGTQFMG
ncbi:hypothetical protein MKW98_003997 [Papaver atlanticum]|uniref:Uncharacterized protein n=1 Tax=Papaver atlanticum TaxID=357466 RepID=A0AAD4XLN9_9MAGN|nr:hypothetical protein MKW98_003997 [Papaver atlanticum]